MKAVILAGGFGTRLRPITYHYPKPMIPIRGKPFLEYLISYLRQQGIREIVLCLHYMHERFLEYFKNGSSFGVNISYVIEKEPLGTAGALKNAEEYIDDRFLLMNGDTFLKFDLKKMIEFHERHKGLGTIALVYVKSPRRYGIVEVDKNWRVHGFKEKCKVESGYINAGVYIFQKRLLDYIPKNREVSLERDVLPKLINSERIHGFLVSGYFIDIGIPKDLYRFEEDLKRGILDA